MLCQGIEEEDASNLKKGGACAWQPAMSRVERALPQLQTGEARYSQVDTVVGGRDQPTDQGTLLSRHGPIVNQHQQQPGEAHPLGKPSGVDAGTPPEHPFQECCDSIVDELAIAVDPLASANATDKGTNKSDFASWICRGFGSLYFLFLAVALVGAMIRCAVLLASHALPQEPPSHAVTGFLDLWQSCTDPANVFSDFSSQGVVFKVLIASDNLFNALGTALAVAAALHLVFPDASQSRRGAWRLGTTTAVCFLEFAIYSAMELSTLMSDNLSLAALEGLNGMRSMFLVVTLAFAYGAYIYVATGLSPKTWRCCMAQDFRSVLWRKLCAGVALGGTVAITWRVSTILWSFEDIFSGKVDSAIVISVICRGLNFMVRFLITRDRSLPVHAANVLSMMLLSFTSMAIRRIILAESSQNPLTLLVSCLKLALLEVVGRSLAYSANIIRIGKQMQGLNALTLGGLVDLHSRVQRDVDGLATYMLVDQFVEVFVFVMITMQELSSPIWSLFRVWVSVENYRSRSPYILLEGAIQMGFEFSVDLIIWRLCFHRLAWDLPQIIRRVLFMKPVAVFTLGLMLMHSLNFYPICMECSRPVTCLVFTECLFDGKVMMDGMNACTTVLIKDQKYADFAVQEMLSRTQVNVSAEQLGCGRQGVDCYGLEDGRKEGCRDWTC